MNPSYETSRVMNQVFSNKLNINCPGSSKIKLDSVSFNNKCDDGVTKGIIIDKCENKSECSIEMSKCNNIDFDVKYRCENPAFPNTDISGSIKQIFSNNKNLSGNNISMSTQEESKPAVNNAEVKVAEAPARKYSVSLYGYEIPYWVIALVVVAVVYYLHSKGHLKGLFGTQQMAISNRNILNEGVTDVLQTPQVIKNILARRTY